MVFHFDGKDRRERWRTRFDDGMTTGLLVWEVLRLHQNRKSSVVPAPTPYGRWRHSFTWCGQSYVSPRHISALRRSGRSTLLRHRSNEARRRTTTVLLDLHKDSVLSIQRLSSRTNLLGTSTERLLSWRVPFHLSRHANTSLVQCMWFPLAPEVPPKDS